MLATTEKGDVVLDPFFGTGTTGAVAKRLGREWIGCERDGGYREAALERIQMALPLDESALPTMQSRKDAPRVAFGALVEGGLHRARHEPCSTRRAASPRRCAPMARWSRARRPARSTMSAKCFRARPAATAGASGILSMKARVKPLDALRQLYLLAIEDRFRPFVIASAAKQSRAFPAAALDRFGPLALAMTNARAE